MPRYAGDVTGIGNKCHSFHKWLKKKKKLSAPESVHSRRASKEMILVKNHKCMTFRKAKYAVEVAIGEARIFVMLRRNIMTFVITQHVLNLGHKADKKCALRILYMH